MNDPVLPKIIDNQKLYSFDEAQSTKKELIWQKLANTTVEQAIQEWLEALGPLTAKNYASGMNMLSAAGLLNTQTTLQAFAIITHDAVIDKIKNLPNALESTKQARAACYISFTRFLNRQTQGLINKVMPSREGTTKTFYRIREKVNTEALTRVQWTAFLRELNKINKRDCLIAKIILQGGKRVSEVLTLKIGQISDQEKEITFRQSKTRGCEKETIITYPKSLFNELKNYIGNREGIVFVTKNNQPVMLNQLAVTFKKAGLLAGIKKVTPHVLRASAVTYFKDQGCSDSDIMKVTGHASAEMIHAYDKSERAQNASKKINLVE
ncbi:MAG: site-specific integrase [Candidatus Babeliaceae bacterium]